MATLNPQQLKEVDSLFCKARDDFLQSLSDQERSLFGGCASSQALLSKVEKLEVISKARRKGLPLLKRIKALSDNLSPYFKILEILCSVHQGYANVALGALHLVLQLASNFTTFFEKLNKTIEELATVLPQFEEVFVSVSATAGLIPERLRKSLVDFYIDLFDFFQAVTRVFSKKNGRLKRTPVVITELLWKPFDVRFRDVMERMKFHQKVVKAELEVAAYGKLDVSMGAELKLLEIIQKESTRSHAMLEEVRMSQQEASQALFCTSVIKWLNPTDFYDNYEQSLYRREDRTAEWLFYDPVFSSWRDLGASESGAEGSVRDRIIWVQGNPGWGKTILAASVIEELNETTNEKDGTIPVTCYHFFDQGSSTKPTRVAAYRAIVTQIFQQTYRNEQIRSIFSLAHDATKIVASEQELIDLLKLSLPFFTDIFIVLDGIDECTESAKLFQHISELCAISSVKAILFSRPNVASLQKDIKTERTIRMSLDVLSKDIAVYLDRELLKLEASHLLPPGTDCSTLQLHLIERTEGMFLWARLMMAYLNSPALTPAQRIESILETTPDGLDEMYHRIFVLITSSDRPSQDLAKRVFMWLAYGAWDLDSHQLHEAMYMDIVSADRSNRLVDVDNAMIVACGGLVEKRRNSEFQFIHLTARDFILSPQLETTPTKPFIPKRVEAEAEMGCRCLQYLIYSIPAGPLSGQLSTATDLNTLERGYPFMKYAAVNWIHHFQQILDDDSSHTKLCSDVIIRLIDMLAKFLALPINLMVWVEAVFSFHRGRSCVMAMSKLAKKAETMDVDHFNLQLKTISAEMSDLAKDLVAIDSAWGDTLEQTPHEIWNDVTLFTPSRFFAKTTAADAESLAPRGSDLGLPPLFSTSATSQDGSRLAIWSIWPSPLFRDFWTMSATDIKELKLDALNDAATDDMIRKTCRGWTARYEIHTIDDQSRQECSGTMILDEDEIVLHLRQSLRRSPLGYWRLAFPLFISKDLTIVIVLRTIVVIDSTASGGNASLRSQSLVLPLDYSESVQLNWSHGRPFFELSYVYACELSQDNKYIVFRDFDLRESIPNRSLAVFSLDSSSLPYQASLMEYLPLNDDGYGLGHHALSPVLPQLIFTNSNNIYLWNFAEGEGMGGLSQVFDFGTDPKAPQGRNYLVKIGYSQCGSYLTIDFQGADWPEIVQLPRGAPAAIEASREATENQPALKKRKLQGDKYELSRLSSQLLPCTTIASSGAISVTNSPVTSSSTTVMHQSWPQKIEIVQQQPDGTMHALRMASLPRFINIRNVATTILWPSSPNEHVKVILNIKQQHHYESDMDVAAAHLPLIIRRDEKSFQKRSWSTDTEQPFFKICA